MDMHSKDLRAHGESEQRLYLLPGFREAPTVYSERERAALAWAEAVTAVGETHVPDEVFEEVQKHFSPREVVELTVAIAMINTWNRIAISFRPTVGSYQPSAR
jgi:alkylhydroperoxidase family enzyme